MKFTKAAVLAVVASLVSDAHAVKSKESPPDPTKVDLPSVPAVMNAGKGGYPELPTVPSILSDVTETLSSISAEATKLQQKMMNVQKENAARMQRQKAVFDRKLKEQEDKNLEVVKANALIARQIMDMKKANEGLLKHAQSLQAGNNLRHSELEMLKTQLMGAEKFVSDSIVETDDSKAGDLEVMQADANATANVAQQGVSLLAVAETVEQEPVAKEEVAAKAADDEPASLLTMLESGVQDMKKQGEASEAKLKDLFLASFQAGVKRHKALLAQQEVLQKTLDDMTSYHTKLEAADKHLQGTQGKLDGQLHQGGLFLSKLSQITMEKPEEGYKAFSAVAGKSA
eukprot:gb/GFBE01000381.1/.p1 GENE.gb/GFBE01000381.1/~~gb/GFBE01000381.1/.p1  ORF type:complete len:343 (+),score=143.72 gb/GFBE01000381.1/:1-1029(+)